MESRLTVHGPNSPSIFGRGHFRLGPGLQPAKSSQYFNMHDRTGFIRFQKEQQTTDEPLAALNCPRFHGSRVRSPHPPNTYAISSRRYRLKFLATAVWAVALVAMAADKSEIVKPGKAKSKTELQEVDLRGKIVCLPEAMHAVYGIDLPTNHEHIWGFKTKDGTFYTLLRTKLSETLFVDEQVRKKELILKGHVLPKTQIFEMTDMKSVRNGVVCDLYYYCDICAIKTLSPGPCMCCQGPVKLVEKRPE